MSATETQIPIVVGGSRPDTLTVLNHHLAAFSLGLAELMLDYDDQSVIIMPEQVIRGRQQIEGYFNDFLDKTTPEFWQAFELKTVTVEGEIAYITWRALPFVQLATDTLYIKNGKIVTQTFTSFGL